MSDRAGGLRLSFRGIPNTEVKPLLASLAASAALIPVLLVTQRRMRPGRTVTTEEAVSSAAALADPEAV